MALALSPVTHAEANEFVRQHHRHSSPVLSHKFSVAVVRGTEIVGVGIAGRPVARHLDDGRTIEITRVATDETRNACSMLYRALIRAAFALGYRRVVTYTQARESGASLRAAGWKVVAERTGGDSWSTAGRPRVNINPRQHTLRWAVNA